MASAKLILTFLSVLISVAWAAPPTPPPSLIVPLPPRNILPLPTPAPIELNEFPIENDEDEREEPRIYSMEIETDIRLRYATTRVSSRVVNPHSNATEAIFHIVLPETAFISSFLMEIEGQVYKAIVKEKEQAQNEYDKAVSSGQTAGLVSSSARDANQFTVSVNIEPSSKVTFNLTYEQLLTRRQGVYEHTVHINPGAIVPQLRVRTNIFEILPISDIKVLPFENDIGNEFSKDTADIVKINATASTILFEPTEKQQKKISKSGLNGHLTIHYDVDRSSLKQKGGEIHVVDGYFVHFFAPPSLPTLPKHVVFVLDTSGSMAGIRIQQTKEAMETILGQLRPEDIFSVVEFSSQSKEWDLTNNYDPLEDYFYDVDLTTTEPDLNQNPDKIGDYDDIFAYPVSDLSINQAKNFVRQMKAAGGTNINDALVLALKNTQSLLSRTKRTPIIIFLTDGEATVGETYGEEITKNIKKANSDGLVSIFSLAFGQGADFSLLKKISSENRGFARKIYEAADTTLQLEGFFSEVASPLLNNVHFTYEGLVTDVTETEIPNFFSGTEWCTLGKIPDSSPLPFKAVVEATGSEGPLVFTSSDIALPEEEEEKKEEEEEKSLSLEKMWAYATIQHLLKLSETDTDNKSLKEKALNLSLSYEFVTPLTSLIVIKPDQKPTTSELQSTSPDEGGYAYGTTTHPSLLGGPQGFAQPSPVTFTNALKGNNYFSSPNLQGFAQPAPVAAFPVSAIEEEEDIDYQHSSEDSETTEYITKWIEGFAHNETHMTILLNTTSLSLVTLNELPDKDYQECDKTTDSDPTLLCKSIWHCNLDISRPFLETEPLRFERFCVVEDRYLGFCCNEALPPAP